MKKLNARAIITHPLSQLIAILLVLSGVAIFTTRPVVTKVFVLRADGRLILEGQQFGNRQRWGYLLIHIGDETIRLHDPLIWSNHKITAHLSPETHTRLNNLPPANLPSVQVKKQIPFTYWTSNAHPFVVQAVDLPSEPYGYDVPVQAHSPWPIFRHDHANTGRSPLPAQYQGDAPWVFQTGKGIFSTPIIDAWGTIYVGSADHIFYALHPNGTEKWHFETGEIIDSAGALPRVGPSADPTVLFPSGDGYLYYVQAADGAPIWAFDARVAPRASYNNWWEGNIALGYDGVYYAGNTNFNYYAINPDGSLRWTYETGSNNWSVAGLGDDGTLFWASNDTFIRAVRPDGVEKWTKRTLGFLAASAALGSDGTVYIGSFDSYFYALEPDTGKVKWKFKTHDHIYSSAALGEDVEGNTDAIYFGSTDGIFYALTPEGEVRWTYDTGDPIRSSPALGASPEEAPGAIVYFGAGNGKLYALNTDTGSRRWSFDTTSSEPELRDRNDLNGSPALGETGVYIGGEHGQVWYVPYDYCVQNLDPRCRTDPGEDLPHDMAGMVYVTPGGSTVLASELSTPSAHLETMIACSGCQTQNLTLASNETTIAPIPAAAIITLRLIVRENGETVDAWVCNTPLGCPPDTLIVRSEPEFPFTLEPSADGHYIHILPDGFLEPNTTHTLKVEGDYYTGGTNVGNLTLGGRRQGRFSDTLTLRTATSEGGLPLEMSPDQVTALEWTRVSTPIPAMLPSLNQIGFDYMDWIMGTVALAPPDATGEGKVILWAIGGRHDEDGVLVADPETDFTLPLTGVYRDDAFILTNQNFNMAITGIPIPFNLLQIRGQFGDTLRVKPGATLYADTDVRSIPTFGPYLIIAGLANNWIEKLLVTGTYITRAYDPDGPANHRPESITVSAVEYIAPTDYRSGTVQVTFALDEGHSYPLSEHRPGILLLDAEKTEAVYLDYHAHLSSESDAEGNLASTTLTLPEKTPLPSTLEAVVILDVFPLHRQALTE